MDLQQRLARSANENSGRLTQPKIVRDDKATVVSYDKLTGQHVISRNGVQEIAQSATNGGLKIEVEAPAMQGKIFGTPYTPKPKMRLSFPHVAKGGHKVFLAFMPGTVYRGGSAGLLWDFDIHQNPTGIIKSSDDRWEEMEHLDEGCKIASDGFTIVRQPHLSSSFRILKATIDAIFPDAGQGLTSDLLLQAVGSGEGSVVRFGIPSTTIGLEIGGSGATDVCSGPVTLIKADGNYSYSPFFLQRFLRSAFRREGKTLILLPMIPYYQQYRRLSRTTRFGATRYSGSEDLLGRLMQDQVARMLGVVNHGYADRYIVGSTSSSSGGYEINQGMDRVKTGFNGSADASYDTVRDIIEELDNLNSFDHERSAGWKGKPKAKGALSAIGTLEAIPNKLQSEFAAINALLEDLPQTLYLNRSNYYSAVNQKDPIHSIYGDSETAHYWIKGISEEYVDAVDVVGEASVAGISKFVQYNNGLDIDPGFLPYQELV